MEPQVRGTWLPHGIGKGDCSQPCSWRHTRKTHISLPAERIGKCCCLFFIKQMTTTNFCRNFKFQLIDTSRAENFCRSIWMGDKSYAVWPDRIIAILFTVLTVYNTLLKRTVRNVSFFLTNAHKKNFGRHISSYSWNFIILTSTLLFLT
jgi:hypothetical protein